MGFFKKVSKKFKQATGLSPERAALAVATGGTSEVARFGLKQLEDPFGVEAQTEGLEAAGSIEERALEQARQFQVRSEAAGAPARQASVGAIGQLQERVAAPPGESLAFQQRLRAGLSAQQSGLSRFGLGDSSVAGVGAGQLTSELLTQEEQQRLGILQLLAGGGQAGFNQSLGGLQTASSLAQSRAQTEAEKGATKAEGKQAAIQTGIDIAGLFVGGR